MKWLETIKTTHEREATAIANNAEATEKANLHMFRLVVLIGLLTFGSLWVLTYLVDQFRAFRFTDIVLVLCFLAVYGFSRLPSMKAPSVLWLYCAFSVYAAVTILSGIFVTQNYVDVMIFVCLFQLPVLTLDRSLRVDLIEVILAAAYLLFVLPHKSPGLASTEVVNVGFFTASALAAGGFLRRTRIANFELERQSVQRETTDYLTGLYNRRKLFEYLGEKEKKGSAEPLAGILMLDIDFFKLYNDSYGHIAGDECLRRIGAYLLSLGQSYPVSFFRYGGEEFLGTSSNFNREELCCFGEKIVDELRGLNIQNEFVERGRVTVSVGLAFSDSPDGRSYEQLISQADSALYEAKRTGRNRAVVWHPGMSTIEQSCR